MSLTASVHECGFAILPSVFSAKCMARLANEINSLSVNRSRAGIRHAMQLRPVTEIAHSPSLSRLIREVLGAKAFPFRATVFEKSPDSNWLVVWHQDTALPLINRQNLTGWGPWSVKAGIHYAHAPAYALAEVLAIRVHLDDSVSENGPLRVLPGTHTQGVLTDDQLLELSARIPPVDCVVSKGGIIAMRPLLVHASSKSQLEMPRRVLHIEYAASKFIASPLELAIA